MDRLFTGLNPAQKEAVFYTGSPLLVLAGAGSGKTRVLTYRAAWLLTQTGGKEGLLLLTFTNKAAGEMKERLLGLLEKNENLPKKSADFFAGTFHSFSAYILRRDGGGIGVLPTFIIYDEDDQQNLIKKIIKKLSLSDKKFKPTVVKSVIESAKNDLISPDLFLESANNDWYEKIGLIYKEYQKELKKSNALDFNDLLFYTVELFKKRPEILEKYQEKYRYILIDEYQDTNKSQYFLTKLLAQKYRNLTVVGDAAQAIYSWRGADYRNLVNLTKDFSDIKVINLTENYRSTQKILDVAYAIISKNEKHPILKLFTQNTTGENICLYRAGSEVAEAEFVAEKIKQLVNFNGIDPTKIAVLYRTNAQSRVIEESFIRHSLPYVLVGGVKFYDRAEVKDVLSLIRAVYNPRDQISFDRIEKKMGKRKKEKVLNFIKESKGKKWQTEELFSEIISVTAYLERYDPDDEEDYRRLENIRELESVARTFSDPADFLENVALVQQEYSVQEKEKSKIAKNAVKLMTLHSSKGLEFDVVFVIGLEEGLLPHLRSIEDPEGLEEERRLCYVGVTRAKKLLFLTYAVKRLVFGKSSYGVVSRFLEDIPENLLLREEDSLLDLSSFDDNDDDWDSQW